MRKVKFKSVNELYGNTSEVLKISSMLKGNFSSKGLSDASLNMGSLKAVKGFCAKKISSNKFDLKEESGKCNTCAHSEETAAIPTKTNGYSGKACQKKDCNSYSFNDVELSSPRVNSPCDGHHRSSETSHPLSVCLSHESSENTESEEETCWGCHTSEGTKRSIKPNLPQTCANNSVSLKAQIFHDKVVPNQLEKQDSECLGDNISFICGSEYADPRADRKSDSNKKNASYNSALIDSFSETEKAVKGQGASSCLVGSHCGKRSSRSSNECSQEILCCSNKSDFSEISSLRDSCAGASSAKGEHSECSVEQVQSSFARPDAVQVGSQTGGEHNSADSMQVETGMNESERVAEVKSTTVVKEVPMKKTTIGSWPAACSDGSDIIEFDVKVCDICGDIGREELLAVCSKCNDGAEHIYCMRVKMNSVPKGDWMCEECVLSSKSNENRKILKRSYTLESETKGSEVEGRKAPKVSSIPSFSSKRPAGSLQAFRQRPLGTVLESPSTSTSRRKMHQSGSHSCSTSMKAVCIPTESSSKSPKLTSPSQVSRGFLFKSKSFSARSLKEDVQLPKKGSCRNEELDKETAAIESKRRVQMLSKSMSLKNMKSYGVNNSDRDSKLLRGFSHGEDLNVSREPKGQYLTNTEKKLRLGNSDSFASMADKRIASIGKTRLPNSSSFSCLDLRAVKGKKISNNSSTSSDHSAQGGSAKDEKKRVLNVRPHVEYPAEVMPDNRTKHSNANVNSGERPHLRNSYMFASEVHMPSWISVIPQLDCTWQGKFEIQRSGGLPFTCDGLQAHLSTYASAKVLELVPELPQNLLLEDAPRETMWPTQFMKNHVTEDNIALYFFAKDLDSYEGSYKNLLDSMIKKDFSLKGNFGGAELLIFPSNLLPEKSQRWNNLLFLWGVFRGKVAHFSSQIPAASASENLLPRGKSSKSASLVSSNTQEALNPDTLPDSKAVASGKTVEVCETNASSLEQKPPDLQSSCSQHVCRVDDQIKTEQFSTADTDQKEERVSKRRLEIDLNCSLQEIPEDYEDCTEADGEHDFKRLKTCPGEMNVGSNSIIDINERCSIDLNSQCPTISGEIECDGAHDMSAVPTRLDSDDSNYRGKFLQQQVHWNYGGNQSDPSVSTLDLNRKVESNCSDQGNIPPFWRQMGFKHPQGANSGREGNEDTNLSLALSLALPSTRTGSGGVPKLDSEGSEVKTALPFPFL